MGYRRRVPRALFPAPRRAGLIHRPTTKALLEYMRLSAVGYHKLDLVSSYIISLIEDNPSSVRSALQHYLAVTSEVTSALAIVGNTEILDWLFHVQAIGPYMANIAKYAIIHNHWDILYLIAPRMEESFWTFALASSRPCDEDTRRIAREIRKFTAT